MVFTRLHTAKKVIINVHCNHFEYCQLIIMKLKLLFNPMSKEGRVVNLNVTFAQNGFLVGFISGKKEVAFLVAKGGKYFNLKND